MNLGRSTSFIPSEWAIQSDTGLPAPDIVFFLSHTPEALAKRGEYGEELHDSVEYQDKVRQAYEIFLYGNVFVTIDASGDIADIHEDITFYTNNLNVGETVSDLFGVEVRHVNSAVHDSQDGSEF